MIIINNDIIINYNNNNNTFWKAFKGKFQVAIF